MMLRPKEPLFDDSLGSFFLSNEATSADKVTSLPQWLPTPWSPFVVILSKQLKTHHLIPVNKGMS